MTTFKQLGLHDQVLRGVISAGYNTPTPIQSATIPAALAGDDITGCAQTGTGKTAAFVLPILDRLSSGRGRSAAVRALVVTPTRELALQVEDSVRTYGKHLSLRSTTIYGGVSIDQQLQKLRRGVDIVIATPGRLLDHVDRGSIDLSKVEVLVLDEADRMFDMGFLNDVRKIVAETPRTRQTLLFSATMPEAIRSLSASIQREPKMIEVGHRRDPASTVTQHVYPVDHQLKTDLLVHILRSEPVENVLVFTRTKHRADRVAKKLSQRGFMTTAIHSNRSQSQRQRALEGFRNGTFRVMVATDVAARGLDVDGISHVINFDMPNQPDDYIHRIGRTGRADATGDAFTFVANDEVAKLRDIERFTGRRFDRSMYPGFDYVKGLDEAATSLPAPRQQASQANARDRAEHSSNRDGKRRNANGFKPRQKSRRR